MGIKLQLVDELRKTVAKCDFCGGADKQCIRSNKPQIVNYKVSTCGEQVRIVSGDERPEACFFGGYKISDWQFAHLEGEKLDAKEVVEIDICCDCVEQIYKQLTTKK